MAKQRKPRTKKQPEISNSLVEPYVNPDNGETFGNPNNPKDFRQFTSQEQSGTEFNRSEKLSTRGDSHKPISIGLYDHDDAIMYYFNEVIKPSVVQNGNIIPVPVIYGSPERWKSAQKDGYYKDKNGKILAPIITFKRDSVEKNHNLPNKLDANQPHLYVTWGTSYTSRNAYSNFDVLTNRVPLKTYQLVVVPDYVNLSYSCTIQTYYVDQLNKLIEAINYATPSYWGDPERFKFKASIDSFTTTNELNDGQDRIVKSTFTLKLSGYIIPDMLQRDIDSFKKAYSTSQIVVGTEIVYSGLK